MVRRKRVLGVTALTLLALVLVVVVVMFLPPLRLADELAKPEFCAKCHNMEPEYTAFRLSAHGRLESCNDCHLPNDSFVNHWFWDGVFGMRDLVEFHVLGRAPYDAEATATSKRIIEANCIRCHGKLVSHVDVSERPCWECHRVMYHRLQLTAAGRDQFGGKRP